MCGGSVRMRNQPPQSYNNDEMTVLLDSDTLYHATTRPSSLLPSHYYQVPRRFPLKFSLRSCVEHAAAALLIPSHMVCSAAYSFAHG